MLTNLQLLARGVSVAARRLRRKGRNPVLCSASEAASVLLAHPGPIREALRRSGDLGRRQFAWLWRGWILRKTSAEGSNFT